MHVSGFLIPRARGAIEYMAISGTYLQCLGTLLVYQE